MTRPLGATLVEVFMSIRQFQVLGCCKHDNPALGGYIIWNIQLWLVTEMNNLDFFKVATFILKQVLSYHYVLLLRLGGYRYYAYKGGHLHFISFEQIRKINYMTRCRQQLWPGAINIYKPAILVILNRQVLHLQIGWISDKYFKTHIS